MGSPDRDGNERNDMGGAERGQLINFLADVELAHYPEYQAIIQNLKGLQETDLAKSSSRPSCSRKVY